MSKRPAAQTTTISIHKSDFRKIQDAFWSLDSLKDLLFDSEKLEYTLFANVLEPAVDGLRDALCKIGGFHEIEIE